MRLGHDKVVASREQVEGIFEEVDGAAIDCCLHAEQSDGKRILCQLRRVRDRVQVMNLLSANALNLRVLAVSAVLLDFRQKLLLLTVWLPNGVQGPVFIVIHVEFCKLELCQ